MLCHKCLCAQPHAAEHQLLSVSLLHPGQRLGATTHGLWWCRPQSRTPQRRKRPCLCRLTTQQQGLLQWPAQRSVTRPSASWGCSPACMCSRSPWWCMLHKLCCTALESSQASAQGRSLQQQQEPCTMRANHMGGSVKKLGPFSARSQVPGHHSAPRGPPGQLDQLHGVCHSLLTPPAAGCAWAHREDD